MTWCCSAFHTRGLATGKARSATVERRLLRIIKRCGRGRAKTVSSLGVGHPSACQSHSVVDLLYYIEQAVREAATICPAPCKLTFDLLTLKVVSKSRVTWATSVPISVFLGLSVLDLGPMYATDRRQTRKIAYPRAGT